MLTHQPIVAALKTIQIFSVAILLAMAVFLMSFWPSQKDELPNMPKEVDFSYHIQPILSTNCYTCHGNDPSSRKADLRLDLEDEAKSKLASGHTAIVNKNISRSELINRILSDDPEYQMPPPEAKKNLSEREIALLKKWIRQGAKWSDHWSLVKPQMPSQTGETVTQTINQFIEQKLEYQQLEAAPQAAKYELIRRVSYILTGLPPSPDALAEFINDESAEAYQSMLDRYLASPHFGERWARHWMDLVRYGESMGHEGDFNISNAYEYRDYLIRAFNQDVPYDDFVREHLAGDMMEEPRVNPATGLEESHLGTAYFFLGEGKHAPVDIKLEESEKIDNMIDVTSKTFSALTVACAKCHDHKFDPIPASDYYAMYGMIESSRLVPKAARVSAKTEKLISQVTELKEDMRKNIAEFILNQSEEKLESNSSDLIPVVQIGQDTTAVILADFRKGEWEGWYTDGIAFGDHPVKGGFGISESETNQTIELTPACASSRVVSAGLQGVLHGPNFSNDFDTIAIRARGRNGTLRIVVDNFQVFQGPLWDRCEAVIDSDEWQTFKLSAQLAKGNKAYLEFFPGRFKNHVFSIQPEDFIEVQWAVGYSGAHPISKGDLGSGKFEVGSGKIEVGRGQSEGDEQIDVLIQNWLNGTSSSASLEVIEEVLQKHNFEVDSDKLKSYEKLKEKLYDPSHVIGMAEGDAIMSPIFERGSINSLSEDKVAHRFFSSLDLPISFTEKGSGRLAWAESLVHPDNPLTARVMVNRLWHHIFGTGIVETVDNFGIQGKIPSHPELLDYLAIEFVETGWSMKTMIKQIMMSDAFKRSTRQIQANTAKDPENIFLHAFPVRRLEAEALRDGILAVTGCLDREMYGPPIPVYLSPFMTGRGRPWQSGPLDSYGRRSIYQSVRRNFIPDMMITFDMPIPFSTFGKRNTTNVPAQSLTLLNDPFVHEQADHWAQSIIKKGGSIEEKLNHIYIAAFSRLPTKEELIQSMEFLHDQAAKMQGTLSSLEDDPELWKVYCHSILNVKEFIHLL